MSLSRLPHEIRQKIFDLAICSPATPPASPSATQHARSRGIRDHGIWYIQPENPALSLLLVNKQFNDDVRKVLNLIPADYHVDIMFVKDCGLWPTWHIPVLPRTKYIKSINATFRLFDPTDDLDPRFRGSMSFNGGDGGPERAAWSFYHLLTGVLQKGPGDLGQHDEYIIEDITVNILEPTDGASHKSIACGDRELELGNKPRRRFVSALISDETIKPEERLAMYMASNLGRILSLDYYTMNYGMTVWENVMVSIMLNLNGSEYRRFGMEEFIEGHRVRHWGMTPEYIADRKEKYEHWRNWLDERRRRAKGGLELNGERPVSHIM
ncbi:hypothetical protein BHE90_011162 [Fusarium euwallaceae]|uniref:Uncharacterized protein n=3 Tax=Fusarium solani species complex TaxID=232080 RepID=A0A428SVC5_9HYPO|nr:hypothetical protein CEP51_013212 [Fusarium floridanum]RSL93656.1 hypothetical protein CEP52_013119 [Fusarium oligoseptatum]RTE74403.1 hypothetical protein BHE90_011162 [Fusarium euwallaceae]